MVLHITSEDLFLDLKKRINRFDEVKWNDIRNNHLRTIKNDINLWNSSIRNNRIEEIILARLRVGHTRLTHQFLYTKDLRPVCETCTEYLTVKHFFKCKKYKKFRRKTQVSENISVALADNPDKCDSVIKYIKMCNLFSKI
uniref:Uncharacterized protein n=1 Tax=Cacopsylla melanoneura TaxID=428564 RepID=A0A8D8TBH2_9HEMI